MPVEQSPILSRTDAICTAALATPTLGNVRLSRFTSAAEAETLWKSLEQSGICSSYQRYNWVANWFDKVGKRQGIRPEIIVLFRNGDPLALFPFALRKRGPFKVLGWLSDSHTNYNMPLMSRAFADTATPADMQTVLNHVPDLIGGCDILELTSQPESWAGYANPLAAAGATLSHNQAYALDLTGGFDAALGRINKGRKRKKFRWQTNKLKPIGGGRLIVAQTPHECQRILNAAFAQMALRFDRIGVANTFAMAGAETFFRQAALRSLAQHEPELRLFALEIDGAIRATFAAGICKGQMSGCFLSIADDEWSSISPGEMLLYLVVEQAAESGLTTFDLGRGEERYKTSWCPDTIPMADLVIPISRRAVFLAAYERAKLEAKRRIKSNATLWAFVKAARARLLGSA